MVRLASFGILLVGVTVVAQQPAAQPKDTKEKKADQTPQQGSLEDLLSEALRNNPDIRVAEAKVREAEAELQRTRIATAQKVAGLHASIEIARKVRDEAEQRYVTARTLHQRGGGAMPLEDMRAADLAWKRAIFEVVKLEGEMPALLGKMPGKLGDDKLKADAGSSVTERTLYWSQLQRAAELEAIKGYTEQVIRLRMPAFSDAAPKGTMAERIRKALDKQITADYKGKPFAEMLKEFEKHMEGIPFRNAYPFQPLPTMDVNLGQVPLGTAIQALNDLNPYIRFVVRDYGILVTAKDRLPPGAVELYDFWKSDAGKEKPKAEVSGDSVMRTPHDVLGSVKAVDSASGLLTLTVGSNAGLAKEHTLEVFRLGTAKAGPTYLGTIRILEARPDEAVAKPIGKLHEAIQAGDKVTKKVTDK
jgi:hypothetical protein